ncbi:MAG: pyruvate, phosphate dikinase [candidate division NC10 bacterium]|nr:pyruvate, phosphate dikinase [candidate division NC10 bacterium]MBI4841873.1 pyruvate, phosphate dikinase [candidate division NC10 bacterium]
MATAKKTVFFFGKGKAEGRAEQKNLLGGKGANLHEMTRLGILVPGGFTISTEACVFYTNNKKKHPAGMWKQVEENLKRVERVMGATFGDPKNPLLVSVRSGARVSMPGMMDTVLNLGLNDQTLQGLIARSKNERFAYDSYRRFIQMFGDVVLGIDKQAFERLLEAQKHAKKVKLDTDLTAADLKDLVTLFKRVVKDKTGRDFPQEPKEQLRLAINAVFESWDNPRAVTYRRLHNIPGDWGTAVNVQAMVFGNLGDSSGTGVAFTRDPGTGERRFFGEYLMNAQGEDVVAGIRTPQPINQLKKAMPKVYAELERIYKRLEKHYREMLDIEFTIQDGKLYMLQCRVGKRTAGAAVKIAVDMVKERLIDHKLAVLRVDPAQLDQLLHPRVDPTAKVQKIAKGLPASPGAAVGQVVFTAAEAEAAAAKGERVILVRTETSPEDIGGMHAAQGILTARGGMTSHAAVVARGMGKPCVAGSQDITVYEEHGYLFARDLTVRRGEYITLDGGTGDVMLGEAKLIQPELSGDFATLMTWADKYRRIGVRTNADTPKDAQVSRKFGAGGIGLCRTEHMFFEGDRIDAVREMILAEDVEGRRKALAKLLPMQKADFKAILEIMGDLPVTVRTLDPPLHEFLPKTDVEIGELAKKLGLPAERLKAKVDGLHEFNPMLGYRGCRLGIEYPEITEMQAQALFEAACELRKQGKNPYPEVMIPLVGTLKELQMQQEIVERVARETMKKYGVKVRYMLGTMIEIPRACLVADEIAQVAQFFSFGTNDLTQTCLALSRDDAGKFLPLYVERGVYPDDPFVSIDQAGVGALMRMGVEKGRAVRKDLEVGICGEHGGEPRSVMFCHQIGLDYVSCSPYRVPIAKLAAAHAALKETVKVKEMGEK